MKLEKLLNRVPGGAILLTLAVLFPARSTASEWSPYPRSCQEAALSGATADGDYLISPAKGVQFTVYCKDVGMGMPKDYLTLVRSGGNYNFSQYTVGGCVSGTSVRVSFSKIRIDPRTLMVDIMDLTFATTTGQLTDIYGNVITQVPYAVATSCEWCGGGGTGIANIDLTGMPFVVDNLFFLWGCCPMGSVNGVPLIPSQLTQVSGKVVDLTGGGYGGFTGPDGFNSGLNYWVGSAYAGALSGAYIPPSAPALHLKFVGGH